MVRPYGAGPMVMGSGVISQNHRILPTLYIGFPGVGEWMLVNDPEVQGEYVKSINARLVVSCLDVIAF